MEQKKRLQKKKQKNKTGSATKRQCFSHLKKKKVAQHIAIVTKQFTPGCGLLVFLYCVENARGSARACKTFRSAFETGLALCPESFPSPFRVPCLTSKDIGNVQACTFCLFNQLYDTRLIALALLEQNPCDIFQRFFFFFSFLENQNLKKNFLMFLKKQNKI